MRRIACARIGGPGSRMRRSIGITSTNSRRIRECRRFGSRIGDRGASCGGEGEGLLMVSGKSKEREVGWME